MARDCLRVVLHTPNIRAPIAAAASPAARAPLHRRGGTDSVVRARPRDSDSSRSSSSATLRSAIDCQRRSGAFRRQRTISFSRSARQMRRRTAGWFRLARQDGRQRGHPRRAAECTAARHHLVEHGPKREDIRSGVCRLPLRLLGRHVRRGAEDPPFLGVGAAFRRAGVRGDRVSRFEVPGLGQLREPEIEDLRGASVADAHDVGRLEVAMDDSRGVRGGQSVRDLHRVFQGVLEAYPAPLEHVGQRRSRHVLHRDEVDALVVSNVVDRDDVGMIQRGGGARFVDESLPALLVDCSFVADQLDGHGPAETRVDGAVHHPHAAFTDRRQDLVMREHLRDHRPGPPAPVQVRPTPRRPISAAT